ncbi:MAG TPA: ArsR family transcriptional regulator [Clostridiales bacterium]|nr:ArsR family transcriptional regulator [Clostridiales bacterium]
MKLTLNDESLMVFKALACSTRLRILELIANTPLNQRQIAENLNISTAIISEHIKQLEEAGLVKVGGGERGQGKQKICYLATNSINIELTKQCNNNVNRFSIPIGLYSKHKAVPTCGIASSDRLIGGVFDDPMVFFDPARSDARLIWFTKGYLEYIIPIKDECRNITRLEISMELASEHPGHKNVWPSEISFYINGIHIGNWISPGNYGDRRGKYTPEWWSPHCSQYGLLKTLIIDNSGCYMDEEKMSDVSLNSLNISNKFTFRMAVEEDANPAGGLTIFGRGFGDYNQDIEVATYYE